MSDQLCDRSFDWRASAPDDGGDGLTLEGYAAVFDQWTQIEDWEGVYMESLARGAFKKTLRERRDRVLLQYDHGHHPVLGSIPIGHIEMLREDDHGLYVRARLHDNWMTQPVRDAVASGAVSGMSFRFKPIAEKIEQPAKAKDLPKRTLTEVALFELGPVAFPAYSGTEVGLRAWADAAPTELRSALLNQLPLDPPEAPVLELVAVDGVDADDEQRGDTMTDESTPDPAGTSTGDLDGAADRDEPVIRATRLERRQMAAFLSGVIHESPGPAASAAA